MVYTERIMRKLTLTLVAALTLALQPVAEARTLFNGVVQVTSYNSLVGQTDSTPNITATGTRTRYGVVAASRDLVRAYGYGAKVKIVKWNTARGCNPNIVPKNMTFVIEDTMNARFTRKIDIWMPSRTQSINFGRCVAQIQIYR